MASAASAATSSAAGGRATQDGGEPPAQDPPQEVQRRRARPDGPAGSAGTAPPLGQVEGDQLHCAVGLAARRAAVEHRRRPLEDQRLHEEGGGHQGGVARVGQGAEGPAPASRRGRGSAWRSWASWSATSSREQARVTRSRSSRTARKLSTTSAWFTTSRSPRPCQSSRATWLSGSRRAPNLLAVRRTPLATARTLPCCSVSSDDDPVGLAEAVGAQHHPPVAEQAHRPGGPRRRAAGARAAGGPAPGPPGAGPGPRTGGPAPGRPPQPVAPADQHHDGQGRHQQLGGQPATPDTAIQNKTRRPRRRCRSPPVVKTGHPSMPP